jgi:hypothetical protein
MKSCIGLIAAFTIFVSVIGGGALIWYLSNTAEFSRTGAGNPSSAAGVSVHPLINKH